MLEITRESKVKRTVTTPVVTQGEVQHGTFSHTLYTGIRRKYQKICKRYGNQIHFNGNRASKNLLVKPKDKDALDRKSWGIHWYKCAELACDEEYIGETSRTFGERYKEHLKEPSHIWT